MKRIFDLTLSFLALFLVFLPMLVISLAIIVNDGFPIIFKQTRVGKNRKKFTILKFRTMRNTEKSQSSGEIHGETPSQKLQARQTFKTTSVNDPRITKIGRFLRKTHLDELPQLFNVIYGDMSLVGVRPDTPSQEVDYTEEYWIIRHKHKPGITGLAQVMNNEDGGMQGRKYWEEMWIQQPTFKMYFHVLYKTLLKVLKRNSF